MLAHLALQKTEHATDLLKRKSLAAEFGDDVDFYYFIRAIDASMPLMAGADHLLLIPPLQLAQTNAANLADFAGGVSLSGGRRIKFDLFCFEHFGQILF